MGLRLWILFRGACICPLFWADSLCAQDTLQIEAVQVNARKSAQGGVGRKTEIIDSAFRDQFRYNMVSDVLGLHSGAQLRTYGAGGIALAGLRGASSEQTAVLYDGRADMSLVRIPVDTESLHVIPLYREDVAASRDNPDMLVTRGTLSLARHEFRDALKDGRAAARLAPGMEAALGISWGARVLTERIFQRRRRNREGRR